MTSNKDLYGHCDCEDCNTLEKFGMDRKEKLSTQDNSNPKDLIGSKKVNLHLIPPTANILEAKVMELGANKYGAFNWRDTKGWH